MGVEAHRQRIVLWEKIFGRGTWHEPIDPAEIYPEQASQASNTQVPQSWEAVIPYLPPPVAPPAVRREYDFYLPGVVGNYEEAYGRYLRQYGADWLIEHAAGEGFTVVLESLHLEILNVDLIRGSGHDLTHTGLQTHMGLAVHVIATGVQTH